MTHGSPTTDKASSHCPVAIAQVRPLFASFMTVPAVETLDRRALVALLAMNAGMFVVEIIGGWMAESMGLVADGLDMGADAAVYLLALLAIGASSQRKLGAARFAGTVQLLLAIVAFLEVGRRWAFGSEPEPPAMLVLSLLALVVNVACLALLRRHRDGEVHMQAAWIFSATDVQANIAVMIAAGLVVWLQSPLPDLLIGAIVSGLVLRGALRIRKRIRAQLRAPETQQQNT